MNTHVVRPDSIVLAASLGVGAAHAQGLPEAFEPLGALAQSPAEPSLLISLAPPPAMQAAVAGMGAVDLGRGARSVFAPLAWARRETGPERDAWTVQLQTDGYKRIESPTRDSTGFSDVLATSGWERALGPRLDGIATVGVLLPSHGDVGGKKAAALLAAGLAGSPLDSPDKFSGAMTLVQNVPAAQPGASRTLVRAEAGWQTRWTQTLVTRLIIAGVRQEAARQVNELSLQPNVALAPGVDLRGRLTVQRIENSPSRRAIVISAAWAL